MQPAHGRIGHLRSGAAFCCQRSCDNGNFGGFLATQPPCAASRPSTSTRGQVHGGGRGHILAAPGLQRDAPAMRTRKAFRPRKAVVTCRAYSGAYQHTHTLIMCQTELYRECACNSLASERSPGCARPQVTMRQSRPTFLPRMHMFGALATSISPPYLVVGWVVRDDGNAPEVESLAFPRPHVTHNSI